MPSQNSSIILLAETLQCIEVVVSSFFTARDKSPSESCFDGKWLMLCSDSKLRKALTWLRVRESIPCTEAHVNRSTGGSLKAWWLRFNLLLGLICQGDPHCCNSIASYIRCSSLTPKSDTSELHQFCMCSPVTQSCSYWETAPQHHHMCVFYAFNKDSIENDKFCFGIFISE